MTPEESKDAHSNFFERMIVAFQEDVVLIMLLVVLITILAATYFHLGLGWVVLTASPLAIFLARKKALRI